MKKFLNKHSIIITVQFAVMIALGFALGVGSYIFYKREINPEPWITKEVQVPVAIPTPIVYQDDYKTPYVKTNKIISDQTESTPFEWGGKLYYLVSQREINGDIIGLRFYEFFTNKLIYKFAPGFGLASALVHDGHIYVTANRSWNELSKSLYLIDCVSLTSCGDAKEIYKITDGETFNSSLTYNNDEKYFVLDYETRSKPGDIFYQRFLKSEDLKTFSPVGDRFGYVYSGCPALRYIKGSYYIFYTVYEDNIFFAKLSRSKDLKNWEEAKEVFMKPKSDEDINTSDIDLGEFEGKVYITYAISNQVTYSKIAYAIFEGTTEELVNYYFK